MQKQMNKGVTYYRVSTKKQGKSGLGLEAQKEAVKTYVTNHPIQIDREYFEIESGKKRKRPVLKQALRFCRRTKAILIIANIDRLARNTLLVAGIIESEVKFVAANKPFAKPLDHLEDAIRAEREGERISQRTKDALREAKKRGVQLGTNGKLLAVENKKLSSEFATKLEPLICEIRSQGFKTIQAITDELNARKVSTFRPGSRWHKSTVHKLINQL